MMDCFDRFEHFSLMIAEISRLWHKLTAEEMEKYGLKGPQAVYLVVLGRHPEGLTASQLCDQCVRDKADVSRMMSAMEQAGLVCRNTNNGVYRGVFCLTERGKAAAAYVCRRAVVAVELAGQGLSDEQRTAMYAALDKIAANLRQLSKNGLPEEIPL